MEETIETIIKQIESMIELKINEAMGEDNKVLQIINKQDLAEELKELIKG